MAGYALPGNDRMAAKLTLMRDHALDMLPVMESMVVTFHQIEEMKFSSEGPGWAPLQDSTLAVKASLGYAGTNILERTSELWNSMTGSSGYSSQEVTNFGWFSGTTLPYATYHQNGFEHKGGSVPARPIVDLTPGVIALFMEMIQTWIMGGSSNNFPGQGKIAEAL